MRAVIVATKCIPSLVPLVQQGCVAILPIAGKMLIEYAIEALRGVGVREATIITHSETNIIKAYIGDGLRWGMQFDYAQPLVTQDGHHYASNGEETLIVKGDAFWQIDLKVFLEKARKADANIQVATYHQQSIMKWVGENKAAKKLLPISEISSTAWQSEPKTMEHKTGVYFLPINDARGYYKISTALVNRQLSPMQPSGRFMHQCVYVETGAKIPNFENQKLVAGFVGCNTHIQKTAKLMGISVVEDNVVIDRGASIENSIVLPNTYVGKMMRVKNSIVNGDICLNMETGAVMKVDDKLMLAKL